MGAYSSTKHKGSAWMLKTVPTLSFYIHEVQATFPTWLLAEQRVGPAVKIREQVHVVVNKLHQKLHVQPPISGEWEKLVWLDSLMNDCYYSAHIYMSIATVLANVLVTTT